MCSIIISGKVSSKSERGRFFMHYVRLIKDLFFLFASTDIVALRQRAKYHAITGIVFALATSKFDRASISLPTGDESPFLIINFVFHSLGSTYWRFLCRPFDMAVSVCISLAKKSVLF